MINHLVTELWFDNEALEAAQFYTSIFPNSEMGKIRYYTADTPSNKEIGSIITVDFTIMNQRFQALNGGPEFKHSEAVSFVIECDDQAEIDDYWDKLSKVKEAEACGWCKDQFGISWQIISKDLEDILYSDDEEIAKRNMEKLLTMKKIDLSQFD